MPETKLTTVYYPSWKDSEGNHFIIEAARFHWRSRELAEQMGGLLDPKNLGNDVEDAGVVEFSMDDDGNIFMHGFEASLVLNDRRTEVTFIAGPILNERCNCEKH